MSDREVAMWEVLNVLRRIGRAEDKSAVARTTGHGRATIRRYVATAIELETTGRSFRNASIFISAPHAGQRSGSTS
jgi:hypothetical protein